MHWSNGWTNLAFGVAIYTYFYAFSDELNGSYDCYCDTEGICFIDEKGYIP